MNNSPITQNDIDAIGGYIPAEAPSTKKNLGANSIVQNNTSPITQNDIDAIGGYIPATPTSAPVAKSNTNTTQPQGNRTGELLAEAEASLEPMIAAKAGGIPGFAALTLGKGLIGAMRKAASESNASPIRLLNAALEAQGDPNISVGGALYNIINKVPIQPKNINDLMASIGGAILGGGVGGLAAGGGLSGAISQILPMTGASIAGLGLGAAGQKIANLVTPSNTSDDVKQLISNVGNLAGGAAGGIVGSNVGEVGNDFINQVRGTLPAQLQQQTLAKTLGDPEVQSYLNSKVPPQSNTSNFTNNLDTSLSEGNVNNLTRANRNVETRNNVNTALDNVKDINNDAYNAFANSIGGKDTLIPISKPTDPADLHDLNTINLGMKSGDIPTSIGALNKPFLAHGLDYIINSLNNVVGNTGENEIGNSTPPAISYQAYQDISQMLNNYIKTHTGVVEKLPEAQRLFNLWSNIKNDSIKNYAQQVNPDSLPLWEQANRLYQERMHALNAEPALKNDTYLNSPSEANEKLNYLPSLAKGEILPYAEHLTNVAQATNDTLSKFDPEAATENYNNISSNHDLLNTVNRYAKDEAIQNGNLGTYLQNYKTKMATLNPNDKLYPSSQNFIGANNISNSEDSAIQHYIDKNGNFKDNDFANDLLFKPTKGSGNNVGAGNNALQYLDKLGDPDNPLGIKNVDQTKQDINDLIQDKLQNTLHDSLIKGDSLDEMGKYLDNLSTAHDNLTSNDNIKNVLSPDTQQSLSAAKLANSGWKDFLKNNPSNVIQNLLQQYNQAASSGAANTAIQRAAQTRKIMENIADAQNQLGSDSSFSNLAKQSLFGILSHGVSALGGILKHNTSLNKLPQINTLKEINGLIFTPAGRQALLQRYNALSDNIKNKYSPSGTPNPKDQFIPTASKLNAGILPGQQLNNIINNNQ
jgi:hypothetical protein